MQRMASSGVQTMGSPRTLKEVLTRIGQPVFARNASSNLWKRGLVWRSTVWTRAEPSTWVTAGRSMGERTAQVSFMNREGYAMSIWSATYSSRMAGAKGRNPSRFFTWALSRSRMVGSRGSAKILRAPRARGPNSMGPWNQPMTFWAASRSTTAANRASSRPVKSRAGMPMAATSGAMSAAEYDGPRYTWGRRSVVCRCPVNCTWARAAAPRADPESLEAGCTKRFRNGPSTWRRRLATQLRATPPARHRLSLGAMSWR